MRPDTAAMAHRRSTAPCSQRPSATRPCDVIASALRHGPTSQRPRDGHERRVEDWHRHEQRGQHDDREHPTRVHVRSEHAQPAGHQSNEQAAGIAHERGEPGGEGGHPTTATVIATPPSSRILTRCQRSATGVATMPRANATRPTSSVRSAVRAKLPGPPQQHRHVVTPARLSNEA